MRRRSTCHTARRASSTRRSRVPSDGSPSAAAAEAAAAAAPARRRRGLNGIARTRRGSSRGVSKPRNSASEISRHATPRRSSSRATGDIIAR